MDFLNINLTLNSGPTSESGTDTSHSDFTTLNAESFSNILKQQDILVEPLLSEADKSISELPTSDNAQSEVLPLPQPHLDSGEQSFVPDLDGKALPLSPEQNNENLRQAEPVLTPAIMVRQASLALPNQDNDVQTGARLAADNIAAEQSNESYTELKSIDSQEALLDSTSIELPHAAIERSKAWLNEHNIKSDVVLSRKDFFSQNYLRPDMMKSTGVQDNHHQAAVTLAEKITSQIEGKVPEMLAPMAGARAMQDNHLTNVSTSQHSHQLVSSNISSAVTPTPAAQIAQPSVQSTTHVATEVNTRFGQESWSQQFNDKMLWLVNKNVQAAKIFIDPPELGAVEIQIKLKHDTTQVSIQSQYAQVREAIESGASRLKHMLSEQGFHGVDVEVSQRQSNGQTPENFSYKQDDRLEQQHMDEIEESQDAHKQHARLNQHNMVDYYA